MNKTIRLRKKLEESILKNSIFQNFKFAVQHQMNAEFFILT